MSESYEFIHFDISFIDDPSMYLLHPFDCTDSHMKMTGDGTMIPSSVDAMHLCLKNTYSYIGISEEIHSVQKPYLRQNYDTPGTIELFRADAYAKPRQCGTMVYAYCQWAPGAAGVWEPYYQRCNWDNGDAVETLPGRGAFDNQEHRNAWMASCLMQLQQYTNCVYVTEKTFKSYETVFGNAKEYGMTVVCIKQRPNVYFTERMSMQQVAEQKKRLREQEKESKRDESQPAITTYLQTTHL